MSLACAREPAEGTVVPLVSLTRPCSRPLGSPPPHQLPAVPARGRRPAPPPPSLSQLPSTAVFAIFGHSAPAGGGAGLTSPREGGGHCLEEGRRAGTWGRQESCFAKSGAARAPHALGPCCSEGGLRKGFGGEWVEDSAGRGCRAPQPLSCLPSDSLWQCQILGEALNFLNMGAPGLPESLCPHIFIPRTWPQELRRG